MLSDIITDSDLYEVAKARAEIAWMGELLLRQVDVVVDIILSRFDDIHDPNHP